MKLEKLEGYTNVKIKICSCGSRIFNVSKIGEYYLDSNENIMAIPETLGDTIDHETYDEIIEIRCANGRCNKLYIGEV